MCKSYKNGHCVFLKDGICSKIKSSQDGLSLHCAGSWSRNKIAHFKYYAEMFSTGMKNKWNERCYIDLFSGPGKCIIREDQTEIDGSCLTAIKLKDKFTKYFFVDNNPTCINDLSKRVKGEKNVILKNEDCNSALKEIIKNIPDYSLNLAFIDPDSLQFLFDNYKELSKKRIDLIVNYPIGPIERAISAVRKKNLESEVINKFHPGWKDIMTKNTWGHSKRENVKNLIEDYIKKIEDLGYFSSNLIPFKNAKNTILYYLIAFSKSEKGIEFWKKTSRGLKGKEIQSSLL